MTYTPEEQLAARIIASLIYPDFPGGPDLATDPAQLGLYVSAVEACRDPYRDAERLAPLTGKIYDCPSDAATAWEGMRQMSGAATPYARIDPLVRTIGGAVAEQQHTATQSAKSTNGTKPEYTASPKLPIDVNDLLAMERKPTIWYAPSFLREGLGLLVGQPNVGKTPAAIQLAIAIATGSKWLNTVLCRRSKVLYLGMEYSPQELIPMFDISRMGADIPREWLLVKTIEDEFPTNAEAALDELEWYLRVMEVRVIIIDVLTAFLPPEKFKQNVYRGDYSELKPYHRLALQYNAAILGVWHASKRESDPKIMYNGSTGMWAAAASRITMYQDQEQRVRITTFPRMGDRLDWALTQEKNNTGRRWVLADASPEPMCSPTELQVYRWLKTNASKAKPIGPSTIAEMTDIKPGSVKVMLRRMYEQNMIQQSGNGYFVEVVTDVTSVTSVTDVTSVTEYFDKDGNNEDKNGNNDSLLSNDENEDGNKGNTVIEETPGLSHSEPLANGVPADYEPGPLGTSLIESLKKRKKEQSE